MNMLVLDIIVLTLSIGLSTEKRLVDDIVNDGSCQYMQFGANHTMCRYPSGEYGCEIKASGIPRQLIPMIEDRINTYRNKLASGDIEGYPPALNMRKICWDDELAVIAQRWVDQCDYSHDTNRRTERFYWVGQTAFIQHTYDEEVEPDFDAAIDTWADQIQKFDPSYIKPFRLTYWTASFSQLFWARTKYIGCGYAFFEATDGEYYKKLYICNFGPGGNYPGESLYVKGTPCGFCPDQCSPEYTSLCTK